MAALRAVTRLRIEAATNILAGLTTEEREDLDGRTRDEIEHVIFTLDQILVRKAGASDA